MHKRDMGVPRGAGVDPQAQWMVTREAEVIRTTGIDEGEPARGIRVPGVGRDLVERRLQLRRKRADVRGINHRRQIYGPLTGWQWPTPAWCGRPGLYQRPDLLDILRRRRIVDHQAQIGPAIDGKRGVFERNHSGFRVPNTFGASYVSRTSWSRHSAANSGLSRLSSSTNAATSFAAPAPARATSARNAPTTNRATPCQSGCLTRMCGSRNTRRSRFRCLGSRVP